ncbi:hypothetical protein PM082_022320 [Marasmius tenuissimus]|nr:hypothetical protein PM082_022320 [Marasmius tenuissimus]
MHYQENELLVHQGSPSTHVNVLTEDAVTITAGLSYRLPGNTNLSASTDSLVNLYTQVLHAFRGH